MRPVLLRTYGHTQISRVCKYPPHFLKNNLILTLSEGSRVANKFQKPTNVKIMSDTDILLCVNVFSFNSYFFVSSSSKIFENSFLKNGLF